jgi:FlaA1/EpsC-like NDP-sugar epimerase
MAWCDVGTLKDMWFESLPIWLTVPFLAAWLGGAYRRVWSRARISEYFALAASLLGGALVSGGVTQILGGVGTRAIVSLVVVFGCLTVLSTCGMRAFPRFVEDLMTWYRRVRWRSDGETSHVIVFGAGFACTLFLRSSTTSSPADKRQRVVLGLVDDDVNLHGRYVFGHKVLGGMDVLADRIAGGNVQEVVLTEPLDERRRQALEKAASAHRCRILEWRAELVAPDVNPVK